MEQAEQGQQQNNNKNTISSPLKNNKKQKLSINTIDVNNISQKDNANHMSEVITIYFNESEQEWVIYDKDYLESNQQLKKITTLTYNVQYESQRQQQRHQELRKIISELSPDIVCLQEATETFQNFLYQDKQIMQNYFISGYKIHGYGCLMLSKFPLKFQLLEFPNSQNRQLLYGRANINNKCICFATVHLESDPKNKEIRQSQLQLLLKELQNQQSQQLQQDQVFLMGDFNFDNEEEMQILQKAQFQDLFHELSEDQQKKVQFTHKNPKDGEMWRPDKVLVQDYSNKKWKLQSISLVGNQQYQKEIANMQQQEQKYQEEQNSRQDGIQTPSDHFGINCEFLLQDASK